MFIQTELTLNPLTLKFLQGRVVMENGTVFYEVESEAKELSEDQMLGADSAHFQCSNEHWWLAGLALTHTI